MKSDSLGNLKDTTRLVPRQQIFNLRLVAKIGLGNFQIGLGHFAKTHKIEHDEA